MKKQYPYFRGQRIWISYGNLGKSKQLAEVIEDCGHKFAFGTARHDYVRVRKYLKNSRRWTKPIRVLRTIILGLAEEGVK